MSQTIKVNETRYRKRFGWFAGYLPKNMDAVDEWQRSLKAEISEAKLTASKRQVDSSVEELAKLIDTNGIVRMYVEEMIQQAPPEHKVIESVPELLEALNHIITTAPLYNRDPNKRNFFPMSSLFVYMMMTPAGEAAFRNEDFNGAIRRILKQWCRFLDSEKSQYVLNTGEYGWLSLSAYYYNKLEEFIIPDHSAPHWGFQSYNAYFHRQIKPECRPIDEPNNPRVIVSANDGTVYKIAMNVKRSDQFGSKASHTRW